MQPCVDELVVEEGADLVVILCRADWSAIRANRLLISPGKLYPSVIGGLASRRQLGIINLSGAPGYTSTSPARSARSRRSGRPASG